MCPIAIRSSVAAGNALLPIDYFWRGGFHICESRGPVGGCLSEILLSIWRRYSWQDLAWRSCGDCNSQEAVNIQGVL